MANRYRAYFPIDDAPLKDGDGQWRGVEERGDAAQLQPGFARAAQNLRFRLGVAEPRLGDQICRWGTGTGETIFTEVAAAGLFSDPTDGLEWIIIAAGTGGGAITVWATRPNNVALAVPLPAGVVLTAATCTQFVQCFNVLIMLRGPDNAPLVCLNLATGFEVITPSASGTGTQTIPNASFGLYFGNRLLLIDAPDKVAASDLLDYTRYAPTYASFRINQGNNDRLVAIAPLTTTTLIMLKDQSILRVDNIYGDLSAMTLGTITSEYGCAAPLSVVQMGTDLAWLSEKGIVTLKITEQNAIQSTQQILSAPLEQTMRRMNWTFASGANGGSGAVSAYWEGKLYVAVPLDDALLLGADVVPAGSVYDGGSSCIVTVTAGVTYQFTQGANNSFLNNGGTVLRGDCLFVAAGGTVELKGGGAVTESLEPVLSVGVNNTVLVYDTLTQSWNGLDTRDGLNVHRWVQFTYQGKIRLGYLDRYGYLRLYEEGLEDETLQTVPVPYVDVVVQAVTSITPIATGQTIRVNGGTTVTSDAAASDNHGSTWGTNGEDDAQDNLWTGNEGGYNQSGAAPWTALNTTPQLTAGGVRFLSTNGALPEVKINGVAVTATGYYGASSWAYVEVHSGTEIAPTPILTSLTTRGYACQDGGRKRFDLVRPTLSTWVPDFTVTSIVDGANERQTLLTAETKNRTLYTTFNVAPWDETNVNADHADPHREDYSVVPDRLGIILQDAGVNVELEQEWEQPLRVKDKGRYCQFKFDNTTGRLTVRSVEVEAVATDRDLAERT